MVERPGGDGTWFRDRVMVVVERPGGGGGTWFRDQVVMVPGLETRW